MKNVAQLESTIKVLETLPERQFIQDCCKLEMQSSQTDGINTIAADCSEDVALNLLTLFDDGF